MQNLMSKGMPLNSNKNTLTKNTSSNGSDYGEAGNVYDYKFKKKQPVSVGYRPSDIYRHSNINNNYA